MKNFRGSALAAGVGTPESVPHELLRSSLHFYLGYKHRDYLKMAFTEAFNLLLVKRKLLSESFVEASSVLTKAVI